MTLIIGTINVQLFLEQKLPDKEPARADANQIVEREVRVGAIEQDPASVERQIRARNLDILGGA